MRRGSTHYDRLAHGYGRRRRADPRIAGRVHAALGDARTVVNVGAGAGSYEPEDRYVLAIERSYTMRAQRPDNLSPAIDARAESLPLDDNAVDAAMAIITVHHWDYPTVGLRELRRVARGPVVVLTFDMDAFADYWLVADYAPELHTTEHAWFPSITEITDVRDGGQVERLPVPRDCSDGFVEAYKPPWMLRRLREARRARFRRATHGASGCCFAPPRCS